MTEPNHLEKGETASLDWQKGHGLLPAIVQDSKTGVVLMTGFMNEAALQETFAQKKVTFFSRTKDRLWTKGESSGHVLEVVSIHTDCDRDAILVQAIPHGPTCHTGAQSCFNAGAGSLGFLAELEAIVAQRVADKPEGSYTAKLLAEGPRRIAQKIGEEGVEVALAAVSGTNEEVISESADLMFHLLVMLRSKGLSLADVTHVLQSRHASRAER